MSATQINEDAGWVLWLRAAHDATGEEVGDRYQVLSWIERVFRRRRGFRSVVMVVMVVNVLDEIEASNVE